MVSQVYGWLMVRLRGGRLVCGWHADVCTCRLGGGAYVAAMLHMDHGSVVVMNCLLRTDIVFEVSLKGEDGARRQGIVSQSHTKWGGGERHFQRHFKKVGTEWPRAFRSTYSSVLQIPGLVDCSNHQPTHHVLHVRNIDHAYI